MKRFLTMCLVFLSGLFLCSCSCKLIGPETGFKKNAVHVHLKADRDVCYYNNSPHALSMCIYQLSDKENFEEYTRSQEDLNNLLGECRSFSDRTFLSQKFITVQPEDHLTYHFDRAENARYVGIVAGYPDMRRSDVVRIIEIPLEEEKRGFIFCEKITRLSDHTIHLYLDRNYIRDYHSINPEDQE